jgi:hypothetical protein
MATSRQIDRKKARHAQTGENRLAELAREWFAEAGETSAREAETAAAVTRSARPGRAQGR